MNILRRFTSLVGGLFGNATDKLEDSSPEALIADAHRRIERSRKEAGKQLVDMQTYAEMARNELQEYELRLADAQAKLRIAMCAKDTALLTELFLQEEELERMRDEKKQTYEAARAQAVELRDRFRRFEQEMKDKLRELSAMKVQSQYVKLHENIIRIDESCGIYSQDGITPSDMDESIDRLRQRLNTRSARINAVQQLRSGNTDVRIRDVDYRMARLRAEEKARKCIEGD